MELCTKKEEMKNKTYAIDLDGTLCHGNAWTPEEVAGLKPRRDAIEKVNTLYSNNELNYIIIFTARKNELMSETFNWLDRHGVKYHAVSNLKMPADLYVDDKAINVEDWLKN